MTKDLESQLESLRGYNEHLCEKYLLGYPSYLKTKKIKNEKLGLAESKRVMKRIDELSRCKRHKGKNGLDCMFCQLEGKL